MKITWFACERARDAAGAASLFMPGGSVPLGHIVSRTRELLGLIDGAQGRYLDWLTQARLALTELDQCPVQDVYQEAFALKNLTILATDFDMKDDASMLAARVPVLAWSRDIHHVQFVTVESLGWCATLRGDIVEALRLFRQAEAVASIVPQHVRIGVNRALIGRETGHRAQAIEEIENALTISDTYRWSEAPGDYRLDLLGLAQVAASIMPMRARQALDRYSSIRNAMNSTFTARIEPGFRAEEAYTHGVALRAEGPIAESADRLRTADATWRDVGFEWRSARAALELTELDAGNVFHLAVKRDLHRRPDSLFAERARKVA